MTIHNIVLQQTDLVKQSLAGLVSAFDFRTLNQLLLLLIVESPTLVEQLHAHDY